MHLWTLDLDPTQSFLATRGASTILGEKAMQSPTWSQFPQSTPCVPTWQTSLPSARWHHTPGLWQICDQVHAHTLPWPGRNRQRLQEAGLLLVRGSVHLALHPKLHKVGYISIMHCQWYLFDTILWCFFLSPLWPTIGLSYCSFKMDSLNLPCGTYTRLCLYLRNFSTNLTSLSSLRSLPRSVCALG